MSAQAPAEGLLLTAREAARLLGRPERWIYRQAALGRLPARKFGRTVLFSRVELRRWLVPRRAE